MQKKQWLVFLLFLFVLADLGWSFCQYYAKPLDGDMPAIVLPSQELAPVLNDPFGFQILKSGEAHAASNRYFAHQTLRIYFEQTTRFFRQFTEPIEAIYLSNAFFLLISHLLLLGMIARYVAMNFKPGFKTLLFAAALITPLFQSNGYHVHMGLISGAVAYTSAYAFPMAVLLYFFFPFFKIFQSPDFSISLFRKIISIPLVIFLAFNGPLIPPLGIIISTLILLHYFRKFNFTKVKKHGAILNATCFFSSLFILLSLYSFYIGSFNAENSNELNIGERYAAMFSNLFPFISQKLGLPLLILGVVINHFILQKQKTNERVQSISKQLKWILIFAIIYLLLLPLGGYRAYRDGIIRHDTFIPIGIALIYFFALSSLLIWQQLTLKYKIAYRIFIVVLVAIFTFADKGGFHKNKCQKQALFEIAKSQNNPVQVTKDCTIMNWQTISEPQYSKVSAQLLHRWEVTLDTVLYYQR